MTKNNYTRIVRRRTLEHHLNMAAMARSCIGVDQNKVVEFLDSQPAFDPLEFACMDPEALRELVGDKRPQRMPQELRDTMKAKPIKLPDYKAGLIHALAAVRISPTSALAHIELGKNLIGLGATRQAYDVALHALRLRCKLPLYRSTYGSFNRRQLTSECHLLFMEISERDMALNNGRRLFFMGPVMVELRKGYAGLGIPRRDDGEFYRWLSKRQARKLKQTREPRAPRMPVKPNPADAPRLI